MDDGIVAAAAVGGVVLVDYLAGGDVGGAIRRKWSKRKEFDFLLEWWASLLRGQAARERMREYIVEETDVSEACVEKEIIRVVKLGHMVDVPVSQICAGTGEVIWFTPTERISDYIVEQTVNILGVQVALKKAPEEFVRKREDLMSKQQQWADERLLVTSSTFGDGGNDFGTLEEIDVGVTLLDDFGNADVDDVTEDVKAFSGAEMVACGQVDAVHGGKIVTSQMINQLEDGAMIRLVSRLPGGGRQKKVAPRNKEG